MKKLCFCLVFVILIIEAVYAEKIGILHNPKYKVHTAIANAFKTKMLSEGYVVMNINYISDEINDLVKEVIFSKCTYCFSIGNIPSIAVKESGIPGVFSMVIDPVRNSFINGLGENISKMSGILVDFDPYFQFSILERILKTRTHGGIVYNEDASEYYVKELMLAGEKYGYKIIASQINQNDNIVKNIYDLKTSIQFILTLTDLSLYNLSNIEKIIHFSVLQKIPLIGFSKVHVKNGALIGFYCDEDELAAQSGELMQQLIKNNGNTSLTPSQFTRNPKFGINDQTAKIMKIEIPVEIIRQADFKK